MFWNFICTFVGVNSLTYEDWGKEFPFCIFEFTTSKESIWRKVWCPFWFFRKVQIIFTYRRSISIWHFSQEICLLFVRNMFCIKRLDFAYLHWIKRVSMSPTHSWARISIRIGNITWFPLGRKFNWNSSPQLFVMIMACWVMSWGEVINGRACAKTPS